MNYEIQRYGIKIPTYAVQTIWNNQQLKEL